MRYPIRKCLDEAEVLLDQQHRERPPRAQRVQGLRHLLDDRWLDAFRRFVEENEPGVAAKTAGEREQLLLATGQGAARAVEQAPQVGEVA